jgi:hypothetical protein
MTHRCVVRFLHEFAKLLLPSGSHATIPRLMHMPTRNLEASHM